MGYYSDVAIAMYRKDFEKMVKVAKSRETTDGLTLIRAANLYESKINEVPTITMLWDCVKWYESFGSVKFIMSYLNENDIIYQFRRIGEEYEDIEIKSNDDKYELVDLVDILRDIYVDGNTIDSKELIDSI